MFKKCVLSMCILAASGFVPAVAADKAKPVMTSSTSSDFFFKPYVGADYQFSKYGNEDASATFGAGAQTDDVFDTGLHGGNVHVGARVHQNLGFELGYFQTQKGTKTNAALFVGETEADIKGISLDAFGYYPLTKQVELIGSVGVSYAKATLGGSALIAEIDEEEVKPRIGAGAQYWFTDNLNARGLVRYQGADFDDTVDNAVVTSVGLNYQF
jgi:hypothetical protein